MFCTKCGQSNPESAAFCSACGNALAADTKHSQPEAAPLQHEPIMPQEPVMFPPQAPTTTQNQQGYYYTPQPPYPPQEANVPPKKKSRTGLVVGLTLGGVALVAAVAVLLLVWPGFLVQSAPVNGFWYSEDRGEALEFRDNGSIRVYTMDDEYKGDYTYDRKQALGVVSVEDEDYDFVVTEDGLYVETMGNYKQAEADFDVDDFIDDMTSAFNEVDYSNTANAPVNGQSSIPNNANNISAAADVSDIQGLWYETSGYGGTIEFYADGTYDMTIMGYTFGGTYEYDAAAGTGVLHENDTGESYPLTVSNGMLETDGYQYTRDYVEQYDLSDLEDINSAD